MVLMPATDEKRAALALRRRMKDLELTQAELAQKVGRVQGWVSSRLFFNPDATIRYLAYKEPETLARLLDALEWTLPELNRETGLNIPVEADELGEVELVNSDLRGGTRTIPVYDLLSAGPGSDGGVVIEVVDIPDSWSGEYMAYRVSGDSMMPDISDGDTVVVKKQDYSSPGNEVVCWTPEHGMLVKRLERITPAGEYVLTSYNPDYRPIWTSEITIYGVVVEVRKRRKVINGNHGPN